MRKPRVTANRNNGDKDAVPQIPLAPSGAPLFNEKQLKELVPLVQTQRYKPRLKPSNKCNYIYLRKGKTERCFGRFTQDKWRYVLSLMPELDRTNYPVPNLPDEAPPQSATEGTKAKNEARIIPGGNPQPSGTEVRAFISRGDISFEPEVMAWYSCLKRKGYPGKFNDFLNDVIKDYFAREGMHIGIIKEDMLDVASENS